MLTVALTGGIATGKSLVAQTLQGLGCYIHYADKVAHQLMEVHTPIWKKIVSRFGKHILNEDKSINRSKLGAIVFSSKTDLAFLNRALHSKVLEKTKETIESLREEGKYKIFISEAALTIEAGFSDFYDKIVVTYCKREIQIKRLIERDNISRRQAVQKIESQLPTTEKLKVADYIVQTSGSIRETIDQAKQLYSNLSLDYQLLYMEGTKQMR